jgi:hypothetical protein
LILTKEELIKTEQCSPLLPQPGPEVVEKLMGHIWAQSQTIAELTAKLDCGHEKRYLSNLDDDCGEPDCEAVEVCALCFAKQAYAKLDAVRGLAKQIEIHCPCGARTESPVTHPHVRGCPVDKLLSILDAPPPAAKEKPDANG